MRKMSEMYDLELQEDISDLIFSFIGTEEVLLQNIKNWTNDSLSRWSKINTFLIYYHSIKIILYLLSGAIIMYKVVIWFMALPTPNFEQSGLVSVVVGAGAAWFGLYAGTSKK